MKLNPVETLVLQEAEGERARAMAQLEHGTEGVVFAQILKSAAESYEHVAELVAMRLRAEAKPRRKVS